MGGGVAPEGIGIGENPTEAIFGKPEGIGIGENPTTSLGQNNNLWPWWMMMALMNQGGQGAPPAPARLPFPIREPHPSFGPVPAPPQLYGPLPPLGVPMLDIYQKKRDRLKKASY